MALLVLAATAIIAAAGYLLSCRLNPYRRCNTCGGVGERRTAILRTIVMCRACHGTGHRLRLGRRLMIHAKRTVEGAK